MEKKKTISQKSKPKPKKSTAKPKATVAKAKSAAAPPKKKGGKAKSAAAPPKKSTAQPKTAVRKTGSKRRRKSVAVRRKSKCGAPKKWWKSSRWFVVLGATIILVVYGLLFVRYAMRPLMMRCKALMGVYDVPVGYKVRGIDISHHQGRINWEELSKARLGESPIDFIYMKATEGTNFVDQNFHYNYSKARQYGFVCGAYHFFLPQTSARLQAEHFINQVSYNKSDLPPVLDIETLGRRPKKEVQQAAMEWLRIVEEHYGVKPIIYTSYKFKLKYLNTKALNEYPFWIAHYYVPQLTYKGEWCLWQFTDSGMLPGIDGLIDCNIFNGSADDLKKMCKP